MKYEIVTTLQSPLVKKKGRDILEYIGINKNVI